MITIWVPKRLVEVDLYNVAARSPQALAQLSENSYARRVQYAAQKVRGSGAKIVMLTGPSASGKTTSAHCLAKALVQQAWACGHRRIAFIHGEKTAVTENRLAGFYQACEELGLKVPEEYVRCGVYHDVDRCAEETRALLALPQRPTCIIFPDDFSALGGYNALTEAGLSIPEDISVMGYDGIYLSRVVKPSLVTYQQNTKSLGRLAADKLIELIEHPRVTLPEQIRVSGKLLDGGSVRIL